MKTKTPDEVARKYGLTYDPVRVRVTPKKKVRMLDLGKSDEDVIRKENIIATEVITILCVCFAVAIVLVILIIKIFS